MDPIIATFSADKKYDIAISLGKEPYKKWGLLTVSKKQDFIDYLNIGNLRLTDENEFFDIVIVGDTIREAKKFGKTLLCFVNHGTGIKNVLYRNLKRSSDTKYMIFVEGDYRVEKIHESGILGESEIFKIGLPKLDPYFRPDVFNREEILMKYGLDPGKKTILFAPTYKPTCIYDVKDHIFTQTTDYNVIIKLHHYSWMGKYASHKHHRIFQRRVKKSSHAVLIPMHDHNILPLMTVADTLISEASSTVFDFLAISKFGIVYDLDFDRLKHSDGEHILTTDNREFLKGAFVHIDSPDKINSAIERALNPTKDMVENANLYRDYFFYKLDGKASERLKETIERLLSEGIHTNVPK